jgi:sirohydrochlorin cobaltochelatase
LPASAYLLVSHGSRDPRPQMAMEHLAQLVAQLIASERSMSAVAASRESRPPLETARVANTPLVSTATLELAPLPLHQQIQQFCDRALALGYHRVQIVPLFLLPGVHVMQDIPAEVAMAQQGLGSSIVLSMTPHVGSHPALVTLLAQETLSQTELILVSHGSRRVGGNLPVEAIAVRLNALPAYWSLAPSLEEQVSYRVQQGCQQIGILPFFLFEGSITDAIAQQVHQLQQQFPYTRLLLGQPLGANLELAQCILDLLPPD